MASEERRTKGIEYVNCNLCGNDDSDLVSQVPVKAHRRGVYNRDVWPVVRCRRCHLMYVNPRIDAEARAVFYSFPTEVEQTLVEAWFIDNADLQRPLWQRFLRVLRQYCPTSKLLDVGCGGGSFLVEARRSGYEVVGLDVSDFFVNHCRQKQRLAVHHGSLEDLELPAESVVKNADRNRLLRCESRRHSYH